MKHSFTAYAQFKAALLNLKWRSEVSRYIDEYLPVFKTKNKNKMRKDNQLCEIEIREVDKIHYKGFAKIQMSGVTMVLYLTSKDFTR